MSGEHNVVESLVAKHAEDIRDMRREVDRAAQEMRPLALPRQRGREHRVPARTQQSRDTRIAPSSTPRAVNKDEDGGCSPHEAQRNAGANGCRGFAPLEPDYHSLASSRAWIVLVLGA